MNKAFVIVILFIFITATTLVCIFQPKTHKPIKFENSNFEISMMTDKTEFDTESSKVDFDGSNISFNTPDVNLEVPNVNVYLPDVNIETPKINIETPKVKIESPKIDINSQKNNTKTSETKAKNNKQSVKNDKKENKSSDSVKTSSLDDFFKSAPVTNPSKKNENNLDEFFKKKSENTDNNKYEYQNEKNNEKTENKPNTVVTKPTHKVLTEEEEIIAWNKWRSDLQNKLMRDSDQKIAAPIGTTFYFTCTVDVHGYVSNLKTWASNPSYTPEAVRVIKPLLISYQHKDILKFPEGSKRIVTNVSGGFTMAHATTYSSPSDYNDFERVKR